MGFLITGLSKQIVQESYNGITLLEECTKIPYYISQTADGGYIVGGISNSNISGDKTENCLGGEDYWIVKTDSLGDHSMAKYEWRK
ncbi:MAG: hypothetical protein IPK08_20460 [Bacteroidetes bacterium]|nr:hypothetical protein [Bacteroidota bacterium]